MSFNQINKEGNWIKWQALMNTWEDEEGWRILPLLAKPKTSWWKDVSFELGIEAINIGSIAAIQATLTNQTIPNSILFFFFLLRVRTQLWSHFVWSFRSQSTSGNGSLCWLGFCDLTNYGVDWFAGPLWPVLQRLHRLIKPDPKRSINPNQNLSQYQNGSKKFNTGRTKPKRLWT